MWFFMTTCYILTALSLGMLVTAGLQGYFQFSILHAKHPTFALLTTIVYLFTETLIIFFFVGSGVSIRDYTAEHKLTNSFRKRSLTIKKKVYPPMLLNMLFVMILFISGGAVDTGHLSGTVHGVLFLIVIVHFLYAIYVQHSCFRQETAVILEMSGIKPNF